MKTRIGIKKVVSIMVVLLLCFSLFTAIPGLHTFASTNASIISNNPSITTCTVDKNLITNGDVEATNVGAYINSSDNFQSWGKIENTGAHAGQKCIQLDGAKWGSWSGPRFEPKITIEANTDYNFSFWYKLTYAGAGNQFTYKYIFNSTSVVDGDHYPIIDGQWHQVAIAFNSGDETNFKFYFLAAENNSKLYLDDMYLFKANGGNSSVPTLTSDSPQKTICDTQNNIFPSYSDTYWATAFNVGGQTVHTEISNADSHSTSGKCVKYLNWGWNSNSLSPIAIEPDTDYTFSVWTKLVDDGSNSLSAIIVKIGDTLIQDASSGISYYINKTDGEWYQYSISFNSGNQTTFNLTLHGNYNGGSNFCELDDFYLFKSIYGVITDNGPSVSALITDTNPTNKYCNKDKNLIENYGMELGSEFWENQKGFSWNALSVVSDDKKNGVNSLKFTPTIDDTHPLSDIEFTQNLVANTSYTFSFWIKATSQVQNPLGYVQIRFPYDSNKMDMFDVPLNFGSDWYQYSITFNTGNRTNLIFNAGSSTSGVAVYFDDFYLFKTADGIAEAPVNLDHMPYLVCARENNIISDYNLELNNNSTWSNFSGWDFGLISKSNKVFHSGNNSLLFKGTAPNDWQSTDIKFAVKPNTDYTFSVWVNAVDGENALLGFILNKGTKMKWITTQMQPNWGTGWYQLSVQFNSNNNENIELYVGSSGSVGSGSIYLDDFYLFESVYGLAKIPSTEDPNLPYIKTSSNPTTTDKSPYLPVVISAFLILLLLLSNKKSKNIFKESLI